MMIGLQEVTASVQERVQHNDKPQCAIYTPT